MMHADEGGLNRVSERIIGCAFVVADALGQGFPEKVYENALAVEIRSFGLAVEQRFGIVVKYRDTVVGQYFADTLVENSIIVELKATKSLDPFQSAQCRNYLKATGLRLCLLINFGGPRVEVKRIVMNV